MITLCYVVLKPLVPFLFFLTFLFANYPVNFFKPAEQIIQTSPHPRHGTNHHKHRHRAKPFI